MTLAGAKSAAQPRLGQCEMIEIWEGAVLILWERRGERSVFDS
jgi:hypothetical protein